MEERPKIGVISCSGEKCTGGSIARMITRKMLDTWRPHDVVTVCLPLFIAGGSEERTFAKDFPTITIDGCKKKCAYRITEKLSGKVNACVDLSEVLGDEHCESDINHEPISEDLIIKTKKEVLQVFDRIRAEANFKELKQSGNYQGCGCVDEK
ncbi:MAG: putative zinc-binding protein [Caldisericia bacterium]|nr:putative zinc-binding protein [Caldisericia bacterium]